MANYRDNVLVYKYGKYIYPNFLNSLEVQNREFSLGRRYKHYAIKEGDVDALVISTPRKTTSQIAAPFAMLSRDAPR